MGQKLNYAVIQDAPIRLREEECALGMEQRQSANTRDAPIMRSREECASGMGQRSNDALIQNAPIRLRGEDFASSMGQHGQRNDAAEEVAPIMLFKEEECASGMRHPAILTKNLLLPNDTQPIHSLVTFKLTQ
jgi:hypothetical protein